MGLTERFSRGWSSGRPETECGRGSTLEATAQQRRWIPRIIERYGIRSVVDIGAGDRHWIAAIKWPSGVDYVALDLVPRHPSVRRFDVTREVPPRADLVMCLWVLNHLDPDDADAAFDNIRASGSMYLMATHCDRWNGDQVRRLTETIETLRLDGPPVRRQTDCSINLARL